MPLVSICIPTFNRARVLDRSLGLLLRNIESHGVGGKFQICISDNGSTDDTQEVIQRQKHVCEVRSARLPENRGFGENLKSALGLATGKWIVVFGDDDFVSDETIPLLLQYGQAAEPLVIFNTGPGEHYATGGLAGCGERRLNGCAEIIRKLGISQLSSITNFMANRERFMTVADRMDPRSVFPHTQALTALAARSPVLFVDKPLLIAEGHYRDWNVLIPFLWGIDMARVLSESASRGDIPYVLRMKCYARLMRHLPKAILLERNQNVLPAFGNPYRSTELRNIAKAYSGSRLAMISGMALCLAFRYMPMSLALNLIRRAGGTLELPPRGTIAATTLDADLGQ